VSALDSLIDKIRQVAGYSAKNITGDIRALLFLNVASLLECLQKSFDAFTRGSDWEEGNRMPGFNLLSATASALR
jgi:hypothetical protein